MTLIYPKKSKSSKEFTDSASNKAVNKITLHLAPLIKSPLSVLDTLSSLEKTPQQTQSKKPNINKKINTDG